MPADRSRAPADRPALAPFQFPAIRRTSLATACSVWTIEQRAVPLISVLLLVRRGSAADPAGARRSGGDHRRPARRGCGELDALAFHEALGRIGAQIETEVGADATLLGLTVLSRFADRGFSLLGDMIQRPRLERADFDRVRDLRLNRLVQMRDMPPALADRAFTELLYRSHPYGHLAIGQRGLAPRADARGRAAVSTRSTYGPQGATVIAAGDASHDELRALVADALQGLDAARAADGRRRSRDIDAAGACRRGWRSSHRPGAAQSELRLGHVSIARSDPDYLQPARAQHGARRPVRQPHQHEPAREARLHLRRAHQLRHAARAGSVRAAGERAVGRDRRRDPRGGS